MIKAVCRVDFTMYMSSNLAFKKGKVYTFEPSNRKDYYVFCIDNELGSGEHYLSKASFLYHFEMNKYTKVLYENSSY